MSRIDDWQEVIGDRQRAVWPKAAKAAAACRGMLVGGTAVTVHLRHRVSEDIDILAPSPLDAASMKSLIEAEAEESFAMIGLSPYEVHALIDGVSVHVFEDPNAESRVGDVTVLQKRYLVSSSALSAAPSRAFLCGRHKGTVRSRPIHKLSECHCWVCSLGCVCLGSGC